MLNISGCSRLVGCKRINLLWDNVIICIWYQASYTWYKKPVGWMLENARKVVVPLVLMNRYINQSRCEGYIMSAEFYVWHNQKGSLLLRTGISKVKARNTHVLNSSYIKAQHHTLWYYPGKESGYLRPYILTESNSVPHKKWIFSATGISKVKAKSTHVFNSKYMKAQHYPMIFTS